MQWKSKNNLLQVLIEAISTIVPVIKQKQDMMSILRVFCDTLPHIPSHRADPIFSLLLESSGPQYLYHVFVFVLELCSRFLMSAVIWVCSLVASI